ncbi:hypothetical protein D3C72_2106440 [compost metagenome]
MPSMIVEEVPTPSALSTLTGSTREAKAKPAMPWVLEAAAMMPAIWVPWPLSSLTLLVWS